MPLSVCRSGMGRACCTWRPRISSKVTGLAGGDGGEDLSRCENSRYGKKVPGFGLKSAIGLMLSYRLGAGAAFHEYSDANSAKTAPCGSATTEKRSEFSMVMGGA